MFKQFNQDDINIEKIEVNASQELTQDSSGINFYKGFITSSIHSFKRNWYTVNSLFYVDGGYRSSYDQEKDLDSECKIGSIASKYYSEKIKPNTFQLTNTSASNSILIKDDGDGNLYDNAIGSSTIIGNLFYEHGIFVMTDTGSRYQYIGSGSNSIDFKGKHHIYEHSYFCEIRAGEMNASLNPTFSSGSNNIILHTDMPTYLTTIGLYNDDNELLAIGKMARPIWNDPEQDLYIEVQFDM